MSSCSAIVTLTQPPASTAVLAISPKPLSSQPSRLGVTTSLAAQAAAALVPSTSRNAFHYADDEQPDDTSLYFEDDSDIPDLPTSFAQSQERMASHTAAPIEAATAARPMSHQHHVVEPLPRLEKKATALPQQQASSSGNASKQAGPAFDEHMRGAMQVSDDDSPDTPMSTDLQPHVIIRFDTTVLYVFCVWD